MTRSHPSSLELPMPPAVPVDLQAHTVREHVQERCLPLFRETLASLTHTQRKSKLSLSVVALSLVYFVIRSLGSFGELLTHLADGRVVGVSALKVTRAGLCKRLQALSHTWMLRVLTEVTAHLNRCDCPKRKAVRALAPFAQQLFAIDDTTLDALCRRIEELKPHAQGSAPTLAGRLACALDLETNRLAQVLYDSDSAANEKSHVRPLLDSLGQGALLVMDLGYFSFALCDWITEHFQYYVTRMREKTTFSVFKVLREESLYRDRIVWLGTGQDRAAHPVRLVEICIRGQWQRYLTNVLDPESFNACQVWALYEKRWTIETAFFVIKRVLGLASLRASPSNAVLLQIWTTLLVYQLLQDVRVRVAQAVGLEEQEMSWVRLLRAVDGYAECASEGDELGAWIAARKDAESLKKQGTRPRRRLALPTAVRAQCLPPPRGPTLEQLDSRRPRRHKDTRRTKVSRLEMTALTYNEESP